MQNQIKAFDDDDNGGVGGGGHKQTNKQITESDDRNNLKPTKQFNIRIA